MSLDIVKIKKKVYLLNFQNDNKKLLFQEDLLRFCSSCSSVFQISKNFLNHLKWFDQIENEFNMAYGIFFILKQF